jgi:hypothetical protein
MQHSPNRNVTPFIPPLPSPGDNLIRPPGAPDPPIPNPQVNDLPAWATEPQTAGNFPVMYPGAGPQYPPYSSYTPYNGTPYIPRLDDFNPPALGPGLAPPAPPGSYFPPPRNLPSQTPHHGANGLSADYTGYPAGPQGLPQGPPQGLPQGPSQGHQAGPPQGPSQGPPPLGGPGFGGGPGGPQGFGGGPNGFGGGGQGGGGQGSGGQGFGGGGGGGGQGFGGGGQGFGGGGQGFGGGGQGFGGGGQGGGFGGGPQGFGPQWPGPPMPGAYPHTPYAQYPMMPPMTGYNPFQQHLPGWGPPAGFGPHTPAYGMMGMPGGMGHTPWHGGGGLPPLGPGGPGGPGGPHHPGMGERMGAKLSEQWHRSDGWDLLNHDAIRFTSGPHCEYPYIHFAMVSQQEIQ